MNKLTLEEIAAKYPTDKGPSGHNYIHKYQMFFEQYRDLPIKVLEIGVDKGHSVKMWKEYFPLAEITAIDILEECKQYQEERVTIEIGNSNDTEFIDRLNNDYGPFDIVIDDGSHKNEDMAFSLNYLFPLLKAGGVYVVEDMHACYWPWVQTNLNSNFTNLLKELLDSINRHGKAGVASPKNWSTDAVYRDKMMGEMDWWDINVDSIHMFMSIAFIYKSN